MALPNKPTIKNVWATSGVKVEPSDTKVNAGWIVERPPHQFQNFLQNRSDQFLKHINEAGIPVWDSATVYTANRSYVQGSDGKLYKALTNGANQNPVGNPTNWMLTLGDADFQEIVDQAQDSATQASAAAADAIDARDTAESAATAASSSSVTAVAAKDQSVSSAAEALISENNAADSAADALVSKNAAAVSEANAAATLAGAVKQTDLSTPATVPAYAFTAAEAQSIFDNALPISTYASLRAYAGRASSVQITGIGIAGMFKRDTSDTTSTDDGGTIIVDSSNRRWKRQLSGTVDLSMYGGEISNNVINVSTIAQTVATLCDSGKKRYLHIPNWGGNFKWGSTVTFTNPGIRIFGDQGGSYNRGTGKDGWLLGQSGLVRFFDLGASRTTGNPADNWQIDGLSFKQDTGVVTRSVDGISFTTRTNGPDRAAIIRNNSFIGLQDAITVENADLATVLASMDVEGCVFQGCRSAINAKGHLFGLRFVGNQCEQNMGDGTTGVIGGSINGPVTITDNMLEGQPNVISIDVPAVTGNRPAMVFARNYLEANSGAYMLRYRCNATGASLEIGPNFISGTPTFSDYTLFEGSTGGVTVLNNDPYPITFKNSSMRIQYGSKISNYRVRGYEIRQLSSASHTPEIVLSDFANFTDDASLWTHGLPVAGSTAMTPYGVRNITPGGTNLAVTIPVAVGDLVCVNVLMRVSQAVAGSFAIYVRNESGVFLRGGGAATDLPTDLKGRWALVSLPFIAQTAATTVRVLMATISGTYPSAIAGITVRNYGAFVNDGTVKVLIEPAIPNIT